ncbi:Fur family transcriptional regulator [Clostridium isatidis]|uniref:Transcriptional repressor n=1 Tax=Clostridium isatidis TaxID=182773 RepID=A0A343JCA1_9CLOT|nr:Fur family transcriptional regulator [Clostridium isatidis]ASW43159.1 transcriptional repressor [Clostridium isatidis]NLZ34440.1 transcriptional repressor [Clostridiales bacterium]
MSWERYLKDNNIRITSGRIAILNILKSSNKGLSAENIYDLCKKQYENLNLSTIYRTLELFEEKEIIKKINIDGPALYVLKKEGHKHLLKCDLCNKSVEIQCPMEEIEEIIKAQAGFSLTEHKLELKGVCEECKDKKNSRN